ncbi:MAG: NUDIX hydrolase [Marinomonas sp.]|jgi:isopentenyldiphosphate isomerase|uniref:NUDIX hydrolase n=1 Tax=unclassified Marinomonas TaxID=196814 RepID=UPI00061F7CC3|nr:MULTISPECIES: NUDIX hydrolase [unclassified Marinomonas]KJZ13324.1 NUDIX hydrolase [Marinomonas sp. S3726]KZM45770.1 NUDIX hydrolase [Marinomonas sp. SBI22]KZM46288.1 NUDIX hydrolase [Marinomonas sp. SBI8L]
MSEEIISLIDKDNNLIGSVARKEMRFGIDYHRATYILVFNKKKELIIQKRTLNKQFCPGYYGIATGGVVAHGESYHLSAQRELKEELGLDLTLTNHGLFFTEGESYRIWGKVFSCIYDPEQDGKITMQADEVAAIKEISIEDILMNKKCLNFTPDTLDALHHYVENRLILQPSDPD